MEQELRSLAQDISGHLERIASRVPEVVASYRDRLTDRVASLIQDRGITVEPEHLIREVAIFAERSDIAEEITRLRAHLDQFDTVISSDDAPGRKLEFVVQEMGRETNTIGSKANDVDISRAVVEIKGTLEKIRELIQNVAGFLRLCFRLFDLRLLTPLAHDPRLVPPPWPSPCCFRPVRLRQEYDLAPGHVSARGQSSAFGLVNQPATTAWRGPRSRLSLRFPRRLRGRP